MNQKKVINNKYVITYNITMLSYNLNDIHHVLCIYSVKEKENIYLYYYYCARYFIHYYYVKIIIIINHAPFVLWRLFFGKKKNEWWKASADDE